MLIGKNSLPIPKIGLLGEYQIKRNNKFKLTYGLAHSVLDKNDIYNESPLIHEKFLYLIKNEKDYEYGFGFVHEAIWAGSTYLNGKFPSTFNDFLKVIIFFCIPGTCSSGSSIPRSPLATITASKVSMMS